jgi:hypothetical protein
MFVNANLQSISINSIFTSSDREVPTTKKIVFGLSSQVKLDFEMGWSLVIGEQPMPLSI